MQSATGVCVFHREADMKGLFARTLGVTLQRLAGPFPVVYLTGSQQFLLGERISQSLTGRTAVLELLPLSAAELCPRAGSTRT